MRIKYYFEFSTSGLRNTPEPLTFLPKFESNQKLSWKSIEIINSHLDGIWATSFRKNNGLSLPKVEKRSSSQAEYLGLLLKMEMIYKATKHINPSFVNARKEYSMKIVCPFSGFDGRIAGRLVPFLKGPLVGYRHQNAHRRLSDVDLVNLNDLFDFSFKFSWLICSFIAGYTLPITKIGEMLSSGIAEAKQSLAGNSPCLYWGNLLKNKPAFPYSIWLRVTPMIALETAPGTWSPGSS